ncbi:MAG: NAD(P)H-dependent oxidoreductase [Ramlibacter sp.]
MAGRRILVIQGHPDNGLVHLCHELGASYAMGAHEAGHAVRWVHVGALDFPLLHSPREWREEPVPEALAQVQQDILWAEHLVLVFPLWLGDMPALLKGLLEQVARPGFAFTAGENIFAGRPLKGRSARIVVTMGMPAVAYRWFYRAHSIRSLERNILGFIGIAPVRRTLIGNVDKAGDEARRRWQESMRRLGQRAR